VSGKRHAPAVLLPPGKGPAVPIVQEAGWAPEPVWTQRLEEKSVASTGDRTPIAQLSSLQSDTILTELPQLLQILIGIKLRRITLEGHVACMGD
jgi:hypothetical protein